MLKIDSFFTNFVVMRNDCDNINASCKEWQPDILGGGFECRKFSLGRLYDGEADFALVRLLCMKTPINKAVIYLHGYNDYFFQADMARKFTDEGIDFYAVDLRRHGRVWHRWQYHCDERDLTSYFAEIDSAIMSVRGTGVEDVTLIGHSTGGLTATLYAALFGKECKADRVIVNSPFYAWNLNAFNCNFLLPAARFIGGFLPNLKFAQPQCKGYGESLHSSLHGRWNYSLEWKPIEFAPVSAGWIKAISDAHDLLRKHGRLLSVPLLVLHSSTVVEQGDFNENFRCGDAILNPQAVRNFALHYLNDTVTKIVEIEGGLHDLVLSNPKAAEHTYKEMLRFISDK